MRYMIILLTIIVGSFSGCSTKNSTIIDVEKGVSLFAFPVVVTQESVSDNQNDYERQVKRRVEMNSFFSTKETTMGIILRLEIVAAEQPYGASSLIAIWEDETNPSRSFTAEYPLQTTRLNGGVSMIVQLFSPAAVFPETPRIAGFSEDQSKIIYLDCVSLYDSVSSVEILLNQM